MAWAFKVDLTELFRFKGESTKTFLDQASYDGDRALDDSTTKLTKVIKLVLLGVIGQSNQRF